MASSAAKRKRGAASAALLLAVLAVGGCAWKGQADGGQAAAAGNGEVWRIEPAGMRVYPSSRIIEENGHHVLEARVELFDELGDPLKGVGRYRFDLFTRSPMGAASPGEKVYSWQVPVLTREQNQRFYDRVTQTYEFRLSMTGPYQPPRNTLLQVTFLPTRGQRLEAEALLEAPSDGR